MNFSTLLKAVIDNGLSAIISVVAVWLVIKYFNKELKEKDKFNVYIENEQKELKQQYVSIKHKLNRLLDEKEVTGVAFYTCVESSSGLIKYRIQEIMFKIIEKNNIVENIDIIKRDIEKNINTELDHMSSELNKLRFDRELFSTCMSIISHECSALNKSLCKEFAKQTEDNINHDNLKRCVESIVSHHTRVIRDRIREHIF